MTGGGACMPALSAANTSKSRAESDSFTRGNGAASDASDSSWAETPESHWQSSSDDEEEERPAVVAAVVCILEAKQLLPRKCSSCYLDTQSLTATAHAPCHEQTSQGCCSGCDAVMSGESMRSLCRRRRPPLTATLQKQWKIVTFEKCFLDPCLGLS